MELNKEQFIRDFKDTLHERQLIKIATFDKFTSDDTIEQYAKEIWNLET